ncbi:hypothetical protein [Colwellia sp. Arc7-635]|uniref:hypothetical protein n=1 Tax=Colwellia sp. Arc7-635 TaxID=2497879 RepID=UPI001F494A59|nr:hypothetical protein [Colwellia sp. Arc7-635]
MLGVGKAESEDQYLEALDQALNNPLVSIAKIDTAKGIIIQIVCREEIQLATYDGIPKQIRSKLTNESALIVVGVTLDPTLDTALEILLIASGISSEENLIAKKEKMKNMSYLDDGLSFIRNESGSIESNENEISTEADYTDIPAITRKLLETQRLKDLSQVKDII